MDLQSIIIDQLKGGVIDTIAEKTGVNKKQVDQVVEAGLPAILAGLQKNTKNEAGAEALDKTLEKNHDGSLLEHLDSSVQSEEVQKDGSKALDHIFGDKLGKIKETVSDKSQADPKNAALILSILVPIVLAQLGKQKKDQNLGTSGLQEMLQNQNINEKGGILGSLGSLLDRNQDGSPIDDLLNLGKDFLGKK